MSTFSRMWPCRPTLHLGQRDLAHGGSLCECRITIVEDVHSAVAGEGSVGKAWNADVETPTRM